MPTVPGDFDPHPAYQNRDQQDMIRVEHMPVAGKEPAVPAVIVDDFPVRPPKPVHMLMPSEN